RAPAPTWRRQPATSDRHPRRRPPVAGRDRRARGAARRAVGAAVGVASSPPDEPEDAVSVPPPGPHGGDGRAGAAALGVDPASVLDLSVSLNPFAPDVRALALGHLDALTRYPDPDRATAALAAAIGVDAERVVLTNGGSEAIALVAAELGPGWVAEPDFSLYRRHLPALRAGAPEGRRNPPHPPRPPAPPAPPPARPAGARLP